ncbi:TlpA family protein disulfide reductase [Lacibacter luteus]|uniref:TlpA family protein disulfide reductase n=1 Tax=Lacibacter luteus TaxID=2508719 RepID=A0A4Q1CJQ4_9BACT|nr:TlpA disulfide reductase family protein [Lacibacter luteus]RXK60859.1 TlpA family protein disulfide reductase [Lacibacter luteus]
MRFIFLIFLFFSITATAQIGKTFYTVITQKDTQVNSGLGGTMEPLRIVSVNKEDNSQVVRYSFDMRHKLFEDYQKKYISTDSLAHFQRKYLLDTANLHKWKKENELLVYIQKTKGKWKIIFDANYSGIFSDDPVYFRDTSFFADRKWFTQSLKVNFWNEKAFAKELAFNLIPDAALPKKYTDAVFNTWGGTRKITQGRLVVGLDSFLVKIYLSDHHLMYSKYSGNFSISNANENDFQLFSTPYPVYSSKDSLYIGNEILMLNSVSVMGDTIVFKKVGENETFKGVQPGAILKSVYGTNFSTGAFEDIGLKRTDSKYTLLHFWGSWCGPCIANLPKLKVFADINNQKVEIVGLPFEQQQDVAKTKKLIQQYQLNWKQIIQLRDHPFQKPDMVKQLAIAHFPTYMLIDNNGRILVRSSNLDDVTLIVN